MTNKAEFDTSVGNLIIQERNPYTLSARSYRSAPRAYCFVDETFDVLEDLENRRRRPHLVWKKLLFKAFDEISLPYGDGKARWSQQAGCSCGCSPGFILDSRFVRLGDQVFHWYDVYLTLENAPAVDLAKSGRAL